MKSNKCRNLSIPHRGIENKSLFLPQDIDEEELNEVCDYNINITSKSKTKAKIMDIPLKNIKLDSKNLRFRHIDSDLNDAKLENIIWNKEATKKLYKQIKWAGGLQEKPIIRRQNGMFVVKEGNLRVVCLRRLKQEAEFGDIDIEPEEIDPVRCIVLPNNSKGKEESILLSRLHIKGKNEWGAFQKSALIYDMKEKYELSYEDISNSIGFSKAKIRRMKRTFENMKKYKELFNDNEWKDKYSYFYELEKKRYTKYKDNSLPKGWVEKNIESFMKWINNGQIKKGDEVRKLTDIVNDDKSYQVLKKGGTIKEALNVLARKDPTIGNKKFSKLEKLQKTLNDFSKNEKEEISKDKTKIEFLKEIQNSVNSLIKEIENE